MGDMCDVHVASLGGLGYSEALRKPKFRPNIQKTGGVCHLHIYTG